MLKRENLRKNFLRVKQMADQNFGRAEKTEVLSEDLQSVEKRVEQVKQVIQTLLKKVAASLVSASTSSDAEKRLKKLPQTSVAHTLIENSGVLGTESVMGNMFQLCGDCESTLANCALQYEIDVENKFLNPMQEILESDLPGISKCKKQLSKLTLDMDSARSRYNQAMKQTSVHGANIPAAASKVDQVREEMEESENKMMQARDNLVTEMYNFIAKESDHSKLLLTFMEAQADYHRRSLETLRKLIPKMKEVLECNPHKPVFGIPLEEHLRVTGRDIALPLEACVVTLMDTGLEEEGLFRIAGMANRVKKLKKSFDAGVVDMEEYCQDQHTVAGVLKQYFRELPEPLLCHYLFDEFINTSKLPHEQKLQALWTLLHKLPDANYNNFRYLIKFLSKLSERSEKNKMTASNIAIVIGPNLLWSEGDDGPNMISSGTISNLVELIIQHCDWFFPEAVDFQQTKRGTAPTRKPQRSLKIASDGNDAPNKPLASEKTPERMGSRNSSTSSLSKVAAAGGALTTRQVSAQSQSSDISTGEMVTTEAPSSYESSSPSYHSVPEVEELDETNPFRSDDDDDDVSASAADVDADTEGASPTRSNNRLEKGETRSLSSVTTSSSPASRLSSFSSASPYTNPPVLRFNPKDMPKKPPRCQSAPPPPCEEEGARKTVHKDVYNTMFALHSLGNGDVSEYVTKVRALWDGHMQQRSHSGSPSGSLSGLSSLPSNMASSRQSVDGKHTLDQVVEFGHYKSFTSHPSNSSLSDMADVSNTSATSTESVDPGAGAPRVAYQSLGGQGEDIFINRSPTGTSQSMSQSMDSNMLNSPPLAEGEQVSPQAQRRLIKKPAPPPPPNRPYSVAVSASVAKQLQTQTWQKQILNQEPIEGEEEVVEKPSRPSGPPVAVKPEKHKTVPERPEKPGKPTSSSQKYATIDRRPSIPPPGRPKIPPPSVPHHTRSASTGSTSMITKPPMVSAPTEQDWNDVFKE